MATKTFYATGDFRYQTRMLRAGEQVELNARDAKLFTALGKISPTKPRGAAVPAMSTQTVAAERPTAAKPRKKAAKKAK
jgi:hypothetical protein